MFPALFSHCRRPNISVQQALQGGSWDLGLHSRLFAAATDELLTIQFTLQYSA
jgi:hypothetical protein